MGNTVVKTREDVLKCIQKKEGFKVDESFTSLSLANHSLSTDAIKLLTECLKKDKNLMLMDLSGNPLPQECVIMLNGLLAVNKGLRHLYLSKTGIGDDRLDDFLPWMTIPNVPTKLVSLKLAGNNIGDEGATKLFTALKSNNTITQLDLGGNQIGNTGAGYIGLCIKKNNVLREINLENNKIGEPGATSINEALQFNTTMQSISLFGNAIGLYTEVWNDIQRTLMINAKFIQLRDGIVEAANERIQKHEQQTTARLKEMDALYQEKIAGIQKLLLIKDEEIKELNSRCKKSEKKAKEQDKAYDKLMDRVDKLEKYNVLKEKEAALMAQQHQRLS